MVIGASGASQLKNPGDDLLQPFTLFGFRLMHPPSQFPPPPALSPQAIRADPFFPHHSNIS
jgi:hypothetical protein